MRILAVRHAVPSRTITNAEVVDNVHRETALYGDATILDAVDRRLGQLFEGSGTVERRALADGEYALDLALDAARAALSAADVAAEEIEFVIYVGVGRAWIEPAMANAVQRRLGIANATCFDVLDGCMSWLRALHIAHTYVTSGVYRCGLIVNCESAFHSQIDWAIRRVEDLEHQFAAFTIGEAATATVVAGRKGDTDDFYFVFKNFPEYDDLCVIPLATAGAFFPNAGMAERVPMRLFSLSGPLLATAARKLIETFEADPRLAGSYDLCVGHAATEKGSEVIRKRLAIPATVYMPTHRRFGNTVSASVPLGLSLACGEGRLRRGDRVLLIVAGAGISIGFSTFTF